MKSSEERYKEYLDFVEKYKSHLGYVGDYNKGEIEMVFDINLFPQCEEGAKDRMIKSGASTTDAQKRAMIGIFDESRWGLSVHEPLRLPDGSYTTFNRWISWGTLESGFAGVVIAPFTTDGKLIFLKNYRNATKNWCIEFPRGGKDLGNSLLKTVKNELSEEMGAEMIGEPQKIGEVFPDSAVLFSRVEIYKAVIEITGKPQREATEAIKGLLIVDKEKLGDIVKNQEYKDTDGNIYEFKDGYSLSALTLLNNE